MFKGMRQTATRSVSATHLLALLLFLVSDTSSSPVRPGVTSPGEAPGVSKGGSSLRQRLAVSEAGSQSHIVMWMMAERELLPRVETLEQSALHYLLTDAKSVNVSRGELETLLATIPDIGTIDVFSPTVLENEDKKNFIKTLVENGYQSLMELQSLIEDYVLDDVTEEESDVTDDESDVTEDDGDATEDAGDVMDNDEDYGYQSFLDRLKAFTQLYADVILSFYSPDSNKLMTSTLTPKDTSLLEIPRLHATFKVLDLAVNRFKQIGAVLEYTVEFSWMEKMGQLSKQNRKGKGGKGGKKGKGGNKKG